VNFIDLRLHFELPAIFMQSVTSVIGVADTKGLVFNFNIYGTVIIQGSWETEVEIVG
jgi:hypothetical protein